MKYILVLAALLAVALAQTRGRSGSGSRSPTRSSPRPKRDWSGEDFWPWMMYWGNYGGGNYDSRFRSGYNNMNNMDGYGSGNMGNNYGGNMGGNYGSNFAGRQRQYSGNSWDNYGWGMGWRGNYPWYGGWWGDNSGEWFSDRLGVAAAAAGPSSAGRSASRVRPVRPLRPSGRAVSRPRA